MATKVDLTKLDPRVKESIQSTTGVVIDGKIDIGDVFALLKYLLKSEAVKEVLSGLFKLIVDHAMESKNKIDDAIVIPAVAIAKRALGVK